MTESAAASELGRLHSLWILGDWQALAEIRHTNLDQREEGMAIALFALCGCQQMGLYAEAEQLVNQILRMGCSREELAKWMLANVHNSLGRASALIGEPERALHEYRLSIASTSGGIDSVDLARARSVNQTRLLNIEHATEPKTADSTTEQEEARFTKPVTGITSYAQNFEDVMLWRALGHITNGFYLDIGAQDPVVDSVSKAFYEKGWRGVHVEPTPAYAALLRQDRPDEQVIQAAIAREPGEIEFFEIPDTGISTGDPDIARSHEERGFAVRKIQVPSMTLAQVFDSIGAPEIHWMKIDVEAMEQAVLESWGAAPQRPWVVVVESTLPLSEVESFQTWEPLLIERGYKSIYFDGLNKFYIRRDKNWLDIAFERAPNIFDSFAFSGKASATFCRGLI